MKQLRDILGYILGLVLFVGLMPTLMWLASGRPEFWFEDGGKAIIAWGVMLCGLLLSIWTIVYMKLRGKGNPMDAFGHEVAPRTQHLMTDGPYRLNRNPMLTGTLVYLIGFALWLFTWQAVVVWLLFLSSCSFRYSAKSAAYIVTLARSMMSIARMCLATFHASLLGNPNLNRIDGINEFA